MSDQRDQPGAAGDGGEVDGSTGLGHTTLATRPAMRPQRPTGKRSRQRSATVDENGGGVDVVSTATELSGSSLDTETKKSKTTKKTGKKARWGRWPSRNPIVDVVAYVYNYLKQVTAELRKVIWPNRKQMTTYTSVVLAFLVFMVTLIAGADYGFAKLVLLVFGE